MSIREMLQLRLAEKKHELVRRAYFYELIDGIAGVRLTHLSSLSTVSRRFGDLVMRRRLDASCSSAPPRLPTSPSEGRPVR